MVSDKTRRSAFIEKNLGLVHSCAGRFRGRGIEYDDLYSAGCMGLVQYWLENGMKETPQQMAALTEEFILKGIRVLEQA